MPQWHPPVYVRASVMGGTPSGDSNDAASTYFAAILRQTASSLRPGGISLLTLFGWPAASADAQFNDAVNSAASGGQATPG
jgi:hypothetical protein